ncbi:RHS repeat-associated core domain-containing protein [Flavobacterium amniphilum]|uniref:RHS repeat-associated core domain-containing protein n=1 Tax=Flavobacterium amniphilum TaxID=1834035 RepID=UPI00202A7BCB|nr:RHS repeat-associated core domain-containing protein [Flavobacterium amniphilum]MCL9806903.1 RHS repeat-associated core domain-containing protein [Flavobacterium amniphilum]
MPLPNQQITDANYRYAFQGQEKDPETGMEAFELRLWDGRLGRWLTIDPYGQYFSPYLGMGNNPISRIDPDGGMDEPPNDYFYDSKTGNTTEVLTNDNFDRVFIDGELSGKFSKEFNINNLFNINRVIDRYKLKSNAEIPYVNLDDKIVGLFDSSFKKKLDGSLTGVEVFAGFVDLSNNFKNYSWFQTVSSSNSSGSNSRNFKDKIDGPEDFFPDYPKIEITGYSIGYYDFPNTTNHNNSEIHWYGQLSLTAIHKASGVRKSIFTFGYGYDIVNNVFEFYKVGFIKPSKEHIGLINLHVLKK